MPPSRFRHIPAIQFTRFESMKPNILVAMSAVVAMCTPVVAHAQAKHILDPLDAAEITKAVNTLRQSGNVSDQARFGTITVQPRAKTGSPARGARIVGYDWTRNQGFVAVVDLAA